MAAPTIRAVGSVGASTAASLVITLPSHAAGDLLIVMGGAANAASSNPSITLASWTSVGSITYYTGAIRGQACVWAKRAASGAEANPSIVCSPSGTSSHFAARAISITAGTWNDTGTLADAWEDVTTNSSVAASVNLTGLVTTDVDRLCVAHLFEADNIATGLTNNGSFVTQGTDSDSSVGCDGYLGTRTKEQLVAGSAGATFSFTSGGTSAPCLGVAFAILPSAPIPPVDFEQSTAGGVGGASGTMQAGVPLGGTAAGTATVSQAGGRITDVGLSGTAAGQGGASGGIGAISGTAAGVGDATGTLTREQHLAGTAAGAATATAPDPTGGAGPYIGGVTYPTATTWQVDITGLQPGDNVFTVTDGTDSIEVTVTVEQTVALGGTAAGQAAVSSPNPADVRFQGSSAAGQADASATATIQPPMAGAAGGTGGASGTLGVSQKPVGAVFVATAADGTATSFGLAPFFVRAADGSGVGANIAPTGYYGPGVGLSGTAAGRADATAGAPVIPLSGTAAGQAGVSGPLDVQGLGGTAEGHAGATATLRTQIPLGGTAGGYAGATATGLQLPIALSGTAAGQAGGSAEIQKVPLVGTAAGRADGAGTLTQTVPLSGTAAGHAESYVGSGITAPIAVRFSDRSTVVRCRDSSPDVEFYDAGPKVDFRRWDRTIVVTARFLVDDAGNFLEDDLGNRIISG